MCGRLAAVHRCHLTIEQIISIHYLSPPPPYCYPLLTINGSYLATTVEPVKLHIATEKETEDTYFKFWK